MKTSKLKFKGDSHKVSKKKKIVKEQIIQKDVWIPIENIDQLNGPILIIKDDEYLNFNPISQKISFKTKEPRVGTGPWVATQVWICQRIESKCTLKSAFDKYISSTKDGIISCDREACGIGETWTISKHENQYILKNQFGGYLGLFEGELKATKEITVENLFDIKKQNIKVVDTKPKQSAADIELELLSQFHTKGSKDILLVGDSEGLMEAKRQGRLHEYLLDRRAAVKKDKFLK